jgi:hypothetical protein
VFAPPFVYRLDLSDDTLEVITEDSECWWEEMQCYAIGLAPDGSKIAHGKLHRHNRTFSILVTDVVAGTTETLIEFPIDDPTHALMWSRTGEYLAFSGVPDIDAEARKQTIFVISVSGGNPIVIEDAMIPQAAAEPWFADDSAIWHWSYDSPPPWFGATRLDGEELAYSSLFDTAMFIAGSLNGTQIAKLSVSGLSIIELADETERLLVPADGLWISHISWIDDQNVLVTVVNPIEIPAELE